MGTFFFAGQLGTYDGFLNRSTDYGVTWNYCQVGQRQINSIFNAAMRGRKSAISLLLTMHALAGVLDRYGELRGTELLELMDYKMFAKLGGSNTAIWAAEQIGMIECFEYLDGPARRCPESERSH